MSHEELEKDGQGNIVTKPVVGWITVSIAGMAVVLQMQYADSQEQLDAGGKERLQFVLTLKQCHELAETLTRQANRTLEQRPPGKPQ